MGTLRKLRCHQRVHADHDLLAVSHYGISILNLLCDPIFKIGPYYGSTDINDPLLGDLCQIGLVGEIVFDILHLRYELHDLLDRQVLVLRYMYVLHVVVVKIGFLAAQDVFQKVDCNIVCGKNRDQCIGLVNSP